MKKVLVICAGLQFGGVERFAANTIKFASADEFQFDYLAEHKTYVELPQRNLSASWSFVASKHREV